MAKKPVVKICDPKKDITLSIDASEHSVSGILSQEGYPIMYLSRRLTNTEFNYANIEMHWPLCGQPREPDNF